MPGYADVYLVPIAEENVSAYKKLARAAGKLFVKHGALKYREYVASDLNAMDAVPFPKRIKLKPGETLVYASVEFQSEAHRNKVMKSLCHDPAMDALMPAKPLFDYKRMVYGGFKTLVEL